MRIVVLCVLAASLLLALPTAHAQRQIVYYTCTDAHGHVTLQNDKPCAKGLRQERRVMDAPTVAPAPAPAVVAPLRAPVVAPAITTATNNASPQAANPAATPATSDLLPPPPLYQCTTYDNDSYLGEQANPPQRCVPLQTTGIGGNTGLASGAACQMVSDQCQRIADNAVCDAWRRHARELQAAWKFARAEDTDAARTEFERVSRILSESTCAAANGPATATP